MRKLTKKISMLMVLAMLVGLFSGVVSASAASKWSFKSNDLDVAVGATVNLDQNQYENFDLYKSGVLADEATYTITWESSDEKVVFVNAKTGQLRAKKDAADGAEAVITANIVNNKSKADHAVSFTIVVGEVKAPVYTLQAPVFEEAVEIGAELKFSTNVLDEAGKAVSFKECGLYRAYFIDGKAIANPWTAEKSGTYTITVGAFKAKADMADLEKAVDKATFEVVVAAGNDFTATLVSLNEIKLEFDANKKFDKIDRTDVTVLTSSKADGAGYTEYVSEVKADKNVLTVKLFNSLANDQYVTVKYADKSAGFKVSVGKVDKITVDNGNVMFGQGTRPAIKLFSNGVEVTTETLLNQVELKIVDGAALAQVTNYNKIYFYQAGKSATVKAIFHTYEYNGANEIVLESNVATINSKATATSYGMVTDWAIEKADTPNYKINWNAKNYIAKNDNGTFKLFAKVPVTTSDVDSKTDSKVSSDLGAVVVFESYNTKVLLAQPDGTLIPISTGSADVVLKDTTNNNAIIGVFTVVVKADRTLTSISASIDKTLVSEFDTITLTLLGFDQYGDAFDLSTKSVTYTNRPDTTAPVTFSGPLNWDATKRQLTPTNLGDQWGKTYNVDICVDYSKHAYIQFVVKDAAVGSDYDLSLRTYAFDQDAIKVNTKLENKDQSFAVAYAPKVVKIATYDKNGVLACPLGTNIIDAKLNNANQMTVASGAAQGITAGSFVVVADGKPWYMTDADFNAIISLSNTGDSVVFNYVRDVNHNEFTELVKTPVGNYYVNLYRAYVIPGVNGDVDKFGFAPVDSITLTVEDTQDQYVALANKGTKTDASYRALATAVSNSAIDLEVKNALGDCYTLNKGYTNNISFGSLDYKGGSLKAVTVSPIVSFESVTVYDSVTLAGNTYKYEMLIDLSKQAIQSTTID